MLLAICHAPFRNKPRVLRHRTARSRRGKILVLLAIALPTLCGLIGLVVDGGLILSDSRQLQHVADSAATAAAMEKLRGRSNTHALSVAEQVVHQYNHFRSAHVTMHCPPLSGSHANSAESVELIIEDQTTTFFIQLLGGSAMRSISVRAVAGYEASTEGAAVVVLDPAPPDFSTAPLPTLPVATSLPEILGGLEVLGLGTVTVDGAVLVNNTWGGQDENGHKIGEPSGLLGLSHAVFAMPLLNLSKLRARDIRVVGGVDNPAHYAALSSDDPSPLQAGMLPVPDPFEDLPVPTLQADPNNVTSNSHGGKTVLGLPLIGPPVTLQPGVYDWIEVLSGIARFQPGIYIIRGKNPITQLSLSVVGGQVEANGVMFYITDSADYSSATGTPDSGDEDDIPNSSADNIVPSVVINMGLLSNQFSGLNDPQSPFHEMCIYQRRLDRRPIVLVQENIIGPGQMRGIVYSKWGHVILAGKGTFDIRFVVGSMRMIALLDMQIKPSSLLPPAQDVYLVE
jgi:hypothetical protein